MNSGPVPKSDCFPFHPEAKLEWWYFHAIVHDEEGRSYSFVYSFFRVNPKVPGQDSLSGYSSIFSFLDHSNGSVIRKSRVDRNFFNNFLKYGDDLFRSNLNTRVLQMLFSEYSQHGPPIQIEMSDPPQVFELEPFELNWHPFLLKESGDSISLSITDHGLNFHSDFRFFYPYSSSRIFDSLFPVDAYNGMGYLFNPDLLVEGEIENKKVSGTGWFDYQWGHKEWFLTSDDKVLGWDWMGINLDDGSSILAFVHKNVDSGLSVYSSAIVRKDGEPELTIKNVRFLPVKYWQSPVTSVEYPVEIVIEFPDSDSVIKYIPLTENQEIPFFGPMRAIWQGAGTVSGCLSGKMVNGTARLELSGYGFIIDFKELLNSLGRQINSVIEGFFPKRITEEVIRKYAGKPVWKYEPEAYNMVLSVPVWDLIARNGKKWRSLFAKFILGALGTDSAPYEELLFSITELNHTGSLIIDDIEDNSKLRRGEECIHLKYGNDLAINAANTLYFLPNLLLYDHPLLDKEQKYRINEITNRGFVQGHLGQGLDLYWSKNISPENLDLWMLDSTDEKILQMYAFKTASGIRGLAETAAIIARKDTVIRDACSEYALGLGVAFQILDDVHNFSESDNWKKTPGEDISEGKLTFAIWQALKLLPQREKRELTDILGNTNLRMDPQMLKKGITLVRESGALEYCREKAKEIVLPSWERFSELLPLTDQKFLLKALTLWLLELEF